jgi:hypothetical protein
MKIILINFFLLLLVFFLVFGLITPLFCFFNHFPVILVYLLIFLPPYIQKFWIFGLGLLMDLFSALPFGLYLLIFYLLFLFCQYLIRKFFSNQSLGAFLFLVLSAETVFKAMLWLFGRLLALLHYAPLPFFSFSNLLLSLGVNLVIALILFFITNFFSSRLRLERLISTNYKN